MVGRIIQISRGPCVGDGKRAVVGGRKRYVRVRVRRAAGLGDVGFLAPQFACLRRAGFRQEANTRIRAGSGKKEIKKGLRRAIRAMASQAALKKQQGELREGNQLWEVWGWGGAVCVRVCIDMVQICSRRIRITRIRCRRLRPRLGTLSRRQRSTSRFLGFCLGVHLMFFFVFGSTSVRRLSGEMLRYAHFLLPSRHLTCSFDLILMLCRLVLETLEPLPGDRKCFRMINGVLTERTVKEVVPILQTNSDGLKKALEELVKQYKSKQDEMEKWKVRFPSLSGRFGGTVHVSFAERWRSMLTVSPNRRRTISRSFSSLSSGSSGTRSRAWLRHLP